MCGEGAWAPPLLPPSCDSTKVANPSPRTMFVASQAALLELEHEIEQRERLQTEEEYATEAAQQVHRLARLVQAFRPTARDGLRYRTLAPPPTEAPAGRRPSAAGARPRPRRGAGAGAAPWTHPSTRRRRSRTAGGGARCEWRCVAAREREEGEREERTATVRGGGGISTRPARMLDAGVKPVGVDGKKNIVSCETKLGWKPHPDIRSCRHARQDVYGMNTLKKVLRLLERVLERLLERVLERLLE